MHLHPDVSFFDQWCERQTPPRYKPCFVFYVAQYIYQIGFSVFQVNFTIQNYFCGARLIPCWTTTLFADTQVLFQHIAVTIHVWSIRQGDTSRFIQCRQRDDLQERPHYSCWVQTARTVAWNVQTVCVLTRLSFYTFPWNYFTLFWTKRERKRRQNVIDISLLVTKMLNTCKTDCEHPLLCCSTVHLHSLHSSTGRNYILCRPNRKIVTV
jgi:hypothetical protein